MSLIQPGFERFVWGGWGRHFEEAPVDDVKSLGGPGSGNFGHAGRPGEVGGSSAGSVTFHGTSQKKLESILKDGLQSSYSGVIWPNQSKPGHIYMSTDLEEARAWAIQTVDREFMFRKRGPDGTYSFDKGQPVVLEVTIPEEEQARVANDEHFPTEGEYAVKDSRSRQFQGDIKPEWITGIWKGEVKGDDAKWIRTLSERVFYVPFAIPADDGLKSLGGPGSGNFGHAGRPGQVGGSSSVTSLITQSGVGSDHVHDLYGDDPTDAIATSFDLDTVTMAEIEQAKVAIKEQAQAKLRQKFGSEVTAYRGVTGTEGKNPTISLSLNRGTAGFHGRKTGEVKEFKIPVDHVIAYSESMRGHFDEQEIVVLTKDLRTLGGPGSGNFGHAGRPGRIGGSSSNWASGAGTEDGDVADASIAEASARFPKTDLIAERPKGLEPKPPLYSGEFEGLRVRNSVPNTDSIGATFSDASEYDELPGIRAVPIADLGIEDYKAADDRARVESLAAAIKDSGEIAPLIVVIDGSRAPYVLEGNHRARAMKFLGKTAVPAVVIVDHTALKTLGGPGSGNFGHAGRPGQVGGSSSDAASQLANAADEFEQPEWYSPGDNQTRVVWDLKAGDTIPLDKPSERGIEGDFDQLGAIHTGDTDYWTERLSEDYNRDASEAKVILIRTDQDDVLIDDPQYAMDPEGGDKATANVLLTARKELKYGVDWVFDGEEFSKPEPLTHNEWKSLPADPDYVYHATSAENARDIANDGLLTHDPSFGTEDQDEWPDGIVEDRSYFIDTPSKAWSFAPAEGKPVLLRVRRDAVPLKRESTGDFYTTKPVAPGAVTIVTADKRWVPLGDLKALGGPGSGNFGHAGRPGQVGGSSSAGGSGGDEDGLDRRRNELTKYGEVANQIELDYAKLRNQILFEMSTKYADDVAVDITQLTDEHPDVIKAKAAYDDSAAKYQKMFDAYVEFEEQQTAERRRETVIRRTTETLEEMGLDPTIANVVDKDPREFEVGGQTFHEAGHYNPNTGMIEINARNGYDVRMSVTRGLVAHEATHVMYDRVKREWAEERTAYNNMSNEDIEKIRMDGTPKPEYVEEFAKKYPISTEMDKVWGFKLQEQMIEENGHTNYAKAYWDDIQPGRPFVPNGLDKAVNETLAEIMSLRLAPHGYPALKQPSQKWQDFATTLHKVYLDIRAKDLAYMAEAKKLDS